MTTIKIQFVAIGSLSKTMPLFRRVIVATVTHVLPAVDWYHVVCQDSQHISFIPDAESSSYACLTSCIY